ncbi:hypothetical protein [Ruminococcus sp.]|uniref:hypothetical protein n=1 Tax=Ruminococcus sp. TaxID=41978 RepID=UPI0025F2A58F|nr:hypothetical protein [Ruminococcus sp.]
MKRSIAMAAAMLISFSAVGMNVSAEENETKVFVTVSDKNRELVIVQEPVTVTDIDSDGKLTINDALSIAHDIKFEGGAAAGYKSSVGQYGLQLEKLWGTENNLSFGFYVNDTFSMGLADEIKNGDYIEAFTYPDPNDYNYFYSYFDKKNGEEADPDSEVTLTLSYVSFDENYAPVSNKLKGAKVTVNGRDTGAVTDDDGNATVKLTEAGRNVISADSDSINIAPPSYLINVKGEAVTTTTTAAETTTTTTTSKVTAKTTTTTSKNSSSPQTGVKNSGTAIAGLFAAAFTAFLMRRRDEE